MKKILLSLILIAGLIVIYGAVNEPYQKPEQYSTSVPVVTYRQDPTLLSYANQLGIDVSKVNLDLTEELNANFEINGPNKPDAIFYAPNTLAIRPGLGYTRTMSMLGHEYIHYQQSLGNKADASSLMQVYNSNQYLQQRMSPYLNLGVGSEAFVAELGAIQCTEYSDASLPKLVLDYCKQYVPNRNILPSYFQ